MRGRICASIAGRVAAGVVERATGERFDVKAISLLRTGSRSGAWFEVVLDEGKNRQLRRIFAEVGVEVLRSFALPSARWCWASSRKAHGDC